mmetsp:Transcript_37278/g.60370  ORF Transcript_37278/g.60370 Transcript_37278/m.60370 type:complete len:227 (+) Transcript_37278:67-747(+)|eukprot:CAMPEP_0184656602 /NCGR_PEP_ID=MMETSP0308-20130426/16618_1 /TAXON_ID=38269 /ORGANISM="Gloeochaete witrockiana, Strain SAG 46.84" /LENGTH=226 /DNA_ID=CAMNT_0027093795 /DNA_START=66 /DNA_END=746 /DNA_ORIENTATION=-
MRIRLWLPVVILVLSFRLGFGEILPGEAENVSDAAELVRNETAPTEEQLSANVVDERRYGDVEELDEEQLTEFLDNAPEAAHAVVLFYGRDCIFSAETLPVFKALATVFPRLRFISIESSSRRRLCSKHSVSGLPTISVFEGSRVKNKYSGKRTLNALCLFVQQETGEDFLECDNVKVEDPKLPMKQSHVDVYLYLSGAVVISLCIPHLLGLCSSRRKEEEKEKEE